MGIERFKKGARAIINFALNVAGERAGKSGLQFPRADVLILENLRTLTPSVEHGRFLNRSLGEFNRGKLVDRIVEAAKEAGLMVELVPPFGTSQVCSRCGAVGRRYSVRPSFESNLPDIQFSGNEKLFACACGYLANSDHNASINLHRRFAYGELAIQSFDELSRRPVAAKQSFLDELEAGLKPTLRRLHGLAVAGADTDIPF